MNRREFITLVGDAAAWPFEARSQQMTKLPNIGFMGSSTPSIYTQWVNAFVDRLREHDWMTAARYRSNIAGQKEVINALPKSLPSSFGGRLTLL
jgi:hypothetical protein